jgi:hypothetical protein
MNELPYMPLVVDKKPYCFWDRNVAELNLKFIESINPQYFSVMGKSLKPFLESENKQYIAIGLRTYYSHALETLMALLCASIQAPDCVVGWLLKYTNCDLRSLVGKIQEGDIILSRFENESHMNWEKISNLIYTSLRMDNEEDKESAVKSFAELWRNFANDFLEFEQEYNNIKHGLRIGMEGFSIAIGTQHHLGEIVPPERMQWIEKGDFGSSFFITENLPKPNKENFVMHQKSVNWNPENFINGLSLISASIENIIVFLKSVNGKHSSDLPFSIPKHDDFYKSPWKNGVSSIGDKSSIIIDSITPFSKQEILDLYKH